MNIKDIIPFAIFGCKAQEIKKLKEEGVTPDEIKALKEAGYTPNDLFKLLEMVETSPAIQEAAPEKLEENINKSKPDPDPEPEKVEEKEETNDNESVLDKLFD